MNFSQTLLTAVRELLLHKFRSALAALGVIFGVASVMAMLSIGEGARRQTFERIAILGLDNLIIRTEKPQRQAADADKNQQQYTNKYGLTRNDLAHFRDTFLGLRYATGSRIAHQDIHPGPGRQAMDLLVLAVEPDYLHVTRSNIPRGRFITPYDQTNHKMVCVLGVGAAKQIYTFAEPLGQSLRIGDDWYEVVGLLQNVANLKDAGGDDINNVVFIPLASHQSRHGDINVNRDAGTYESATVELDAIALQLDNEDDVLPTSKRLEVYLKQTHKKNDYKLIVPIELMAQKAATQRIFTIVMSSIASISLLVGGIGIMNIMLANVSDRRREIGTRRALGARRLDIVRQFLLEAATLTTSGGLVGIAVGYGLALAISSWASWPVTITWPAVALALFVSCASGLIFGFWPAWQAAKVNPIEALRAG